MKFNWPVFLLGALMILNIVLCLMVWNMSGKLDDLEHRFDEKIRDSRQEVIQLLRG